MLTVRRKIITVLAMAILVIAGLITASPAVANDGWTSSGGSSSGWTSGSTSSTTSTGYGSTSTMSVPICVQPVNTARNVPVYAAWASWRISGLWYTYRTECRGPQAVEIHVKQVYAGTGKALGWVDIRWGSDEVPYFATVYLNKSHPDRPGTYWSWQGTIAHEIGHVLHAATAHNSVYGSILNLKTRPAVYPSTWDRKVARWYWQWKR